MSHEEALTIDTVVEVLKKNRLVMITTALPDGKLLAHPMAIQEVDEDATLWFFVSKEGDQADALRQGSEVNVAVSDTGTWLSVAGSAEFVDDPAKVDELWTNSAEAYFTGKDDPKLGLLKVTGESAQFWGVPGGKVAALVGIVASRITGNEPPGQSGTTEL